MLQLCLKFVVRSSCMHKSPLSIHENIKMICLTRVEKPVQQLYISTPNFNIERRALNSIQSIQGCGKLQSFKGGHYDTILKLVIE